MLPLLLLIYGAATAASRSFEIDYENGVFLKDGEPFQYLSGTIHYFRVPEAYWEDRLLKLRAMGADTLQTYIMWNFHEPEKGQYDFSGMRNFSKFVELAGGLGLSVLLRLGPYMCGEEDMGGLPAWLLKHPDIHLRSADPRFLTAVKAWWDVLLPRVRPLLYANGGPILMVQIENEYGSYVHQAKYKDLAYLEFLKNLTIQHLGPYPQCTIFSTDGPSLMANGSFPGVFPTVDFGPTSHLKTVKEYFASQQAVCPGRRCPLVNSEYYPGWFDMWGDATHQQTSVADTLPTIEHMFHLNASFNIYLAHGGTNFGFQAGSEGNTKQFGSITTSYDYDAPISEAGDLTPKFWAIRQTLERLRGRMNPHPVPATSEKFWYGDVPFQRLGSIFDFLDTLSPLETRKYSQFPLTMEEADQNYGYAMYETVISKCGSILNVSAIRDRGYVFVNEKPAGIMQRKANIYHKENQTLIVPMKKGDKLQILVENQGRICYTTSLDDRKGIFGNISLDGEILQDWATLPIDVSRFPNSPVESPISKANFIPGFYLGKIQLTPRVGDTFFEPEGWGRGLLIVNGMNLGRYWPDRGPQVTLYAPGSFLKKETSILLFEMERAGNKDEAGLFHSRLINYHKLKTCNEE